MEIVFFIFGLAKTALCERLLTSLENYLLKIWFGKTGNILTRKTIEAILDIRRVVFISWYIFYHLPPM